MIYGNPAGVSQVSSRCGWLGFHLFMDEAVHFPSDGYYLWGHHTHCWNGSLRSQPAPWIPPNNGDEQ